jgi:hypothetical protein
VRKAAISPSWYHGIATHPRKTKVANLDVAVAVEENVGGLEVSVEDSTVRLCVAVLHRPQHLRKHPPNLGLARERYTQSSAQCSVCVYV